MQPWTVEYGTLWALETGNGLPPFCPARVEVEFAELGENDLEELTVAMNLPNPEPIRQRLQSNRRCFGLRAASQACGERSRTIAAYGWVTHGVEHVGELERRFNLHDDEAYIWDCGTVPAWRGHRFYSALLSHMIYRLHDEGASRVWIGASRQNQPSIQGFANAGFQPVIDCAYGRFLRLILLWIQSAPSAQQSLVRAAHRILLNKHERRLGPLVIGYTRDP